MVIHRPDAFARRIGRYGLIGFGESYMAGEWSSDDLVGLLTEFAKSVADLDSACAATASAARRGAASRRSQHNSRAQARRNIAEHYDLSNDLFAEFLDETMTYSSALFDDAARAAGPTCADAQRPQDRPPARRGARRPRQPRARDRHRLGRTVHRAPRRGARTSARSRCRPSSSAGPAAGGRRPGLSRPGRRSSSSDYRDVDGRYDAVRVGRDDRGGRIPVLADVLPDTRPVGVAGRPGRDPGHHHAARPNAGHPQHLHLDPEVHLPRRHCCPSIEAIIGDHRTAHAAAHRRTCTRCDRTTPRRCGCGGSAFTERRDAVSALGFDEVFHRMWWLYLAYSEAGFRVRISRCVPMDLRTDGKWPMNFIVVSAASLAILVVVHGITVPHRPPDRPLQRRRRHLGHRLRRGRGRRRGVGHR